LVFRVDTIGQRVIKEPAKISAVSGWRRPTPTRRRRLVAKSVTAIFTLCDFRGDDRQNLSRNAVELLRFVDDVDQRLLLGHLSQQAQHG
jgi:hypothetical protein